MSPEAEIRRRIGEQGRITFSEFMELALFWPPGGYYLSPGTLEASGDYYTSPQAHPAFAALLAVQLLQMWSLLDEPDPFTVVEIGAGNGLLCRDLVAYSCHLPQAFRRALRYLCLDRNLASGLEQEVFTGNGAAVGRVAASIIASGPASTGQPEAAGLPLRGIRGCFLSNELLDAFPVHQVTKVDGRLLEVYVTLRDGELATVTAAPSTPMLVARLESLRVELIEGQTAEINLGIDSWARQVAGALEAGFVLTIDYGHQAEELYSAERRLRGTLTTYFRHTQTDSPLRRIGRQDITAQVDFTSAQELGEQAGLDVLGLTNQSRFLGNLGLQIYQERVLQQGLTRRQIQANRTAMMDLVRPGGLGDFKVLAQGKNVGRPELWGFGSSGSSGFSKEAEAIARELPVPVLSTGHLPLLESRFPHVEMEFDESWSLTGDVSHQERP